MRWVDRILTSSHHTHDVVLRRGGLESTIVHLGADVEHTYRMVPRDPAWRERLGIAPDTMVVAQLGALVPHKGLDVLIGATALLRAKGCAVHALIIGDGPERARIEKLAAELSPDAVTFLGRVADVAPYFQHVADVHALPSEEEGFGIAVIEAAGCGLPNVVSVPGALEEIVQDRIDGLYVRGGDPAQFADALESLYRDPEHRRALGRAAARRAREEFSFSAYRARMVGQVYGMLEGRGRRAN